MIPDDREWPESVATAITFNPIQQREEDTTTDVLSPLEEAGTTDPDGITTG